MNGEHQSQEHLKVFDIELVEYDIQYLYEFLKPI